MMLLNLKKDKYLQIFNYLLEFSKLRSSPVRDIDSSDTQYPEKIWFADIPQDEIFDCITFPTYNQDAEYWLKISKPKNEPQPPLFPKLSESLESWVVKESLTDESGIPILKEVLLKSGKEISLTDRPDVKVEFEAYLNDIWIDDLDFYKKKFDEYETKRLKYENQSKIYKNFFSIYNKIQQFGEEFELIIGVGLLNFREDGNSHLICRHIFTSKVEITFDSSIRILPSIENEIKIETDAIIDLTEQFDPSDIIEAVQKASTFLKEKDISGNPFDAQIKDAIQIFSNRIRSDGESNNELSKPNEISKKPTVYFAPALILRKRNTRSFSALYEKIIEDINNADDSLNIPSINDIIGFVDQDDPFSNGVDDENTIQLKDETIYFPKKYNDEQIEIIEKSRRNNKVLVQGPPGTGKSHTIANLICHLLANGKKVLVTALTKRALEVLKDKLPDDFKNLSVNLLSGDSTSIQDLNASVNAINDEISSITNFSAYKKEIEEKEVELCLLREDKAVTKNDWLKVKEQSTRRQNINRNYQGTLSEIAERIEQERPAFAWFKDEFTDVNNIGLITELENFYLQTTNYKNIDCGVFTLTIPQKDKLPSLSDLNEYYKIIDDLKKHPVKNENIAIDCKDYPDLKRQLNNLNKLFSEIESSILPFKSKLITEYKSNLIFWKDKLSRTKNTLAELQDEKLKQLDRSVEIQYPNDKNLIQLKNDAQVLLSYLNEGNTLSGVLFSLKKALLPKKVKEKLYFIEGVKVNGSPCDTISEFNTVLTDISIKQDFEELEIIWEIKANGNSRFLFDKAKFYRQVVDDTEALINLLENTNNIKTVIETNSTIRIHNYDVEKIGKLINECEHDQLLSLASVFKEKFAEVSKYLSFSSIHAIAATIRNAIENIDTHKYEQALFEIDILNSEKEKYNSYKRLQSNLQYHFPITVNDILEDTFEFSNFKQLENAIYLKHASFEIAKLLAKNYETKLINKISELEQNEERLISKIASKKAWLHIVERLSSNPMMQQHLTAWKQAIRAIPKTRTSPNYHHYRKVANKEMEYCKQSVACWVMPLYQVVENFVPEPGMFDYVIIDEASQLGPDAVFLFYISKNIIVVGDDKQTAPEYIGVPDGMVKTMIHKHLKPTPSREIPYADFYGTQHSFFDHCDRLCAGKRVVLREHFRCMPEIIEFSNKYFYAPDGKGLYPLKQHSEKRLDPLKTFYCKNGNVEGQNENIINRVEAEEIVKKIVEIVKDESYFKIEDGIRKPKTIGIITLQGNLQSKLIEGKLMDLIGSDEMQKRKIICGNSVSFQGDERDIIFLSMIVAQDHRGIALTKEKDERRYNVAVSRAKEQIWLFHSLQLEDLQSKTQGVVDLRYKLLDHFQNYKENRKVSAGKFGRKLGSQPAPFESWFEVDVHDDIIEKGYKVIPAYEVVRGKHRIDLAVVLNNGVKIAVECDGDAWHGPEQAWADAGRQRFLERIGGWQFFRVRGAEYYSNRKKALEPLWGILKRQNDEVGDPYSESNVPSKEVYPKVEKNELKLERTNLKHYEIDDKGQLPLFDNLIKHPPKLNSESSPFSKPINMKGQTNGLTNPFNDFLIFTNHQNVYKVQNKLHKSRQQIISELELESGEKSLFTANTNNYQGYIIIAFENGKVAKVSLNSYQTEFNRKKLKNAINNESKVIFIDQIKEDVDLVAISSIDKIVVFNTKKINPVDSKLTKGVQVMKSKDNSKMIRIKKLSQVNLTDPNYYRKDGALNVVGYYLKTEDSL